MYMLATYDGLKVKVDRSAPDGGRIEGEFIYLNLKDIERIAMKDFA